MANPAPTINQINAFNATQGTVIDFNIIGGTDLVRSNKIYIYDLSNNSLMCTHLYPSTESIHELPVNTDVSMEYASGKTSADFVNNKQYYAQIQTFTDVAGTQGGSGLSVAKLFWCLPTPTLTFDTIPATISTTSYNPTVVYNSNITSSNVTVPNIVQQYQFNLYTGTGTLVQTSGIIVGNGDQEGDTTAWDLSYNFSGLSVGSSYYFTISVTTTEGMTLTAQSSTFTISIDTPVLGKATVVNDACNGYISVTSNLSGEYEHEESADSGEIISFTTDSVNNITELDVDFSPVQDGTPWMSAQNTEPYTFRAVPTQTEDFGHESDTIVGGTIAWNQLIDVKGSSISKTENGATFIDNRDGTYTVSTDSSGATSDAFLSLGAFSVISTHKYLLISCPNGGGTNTYRAYLTGSVGSGGYDIGSGFIYIASATGTTYCVCAWVKSGQIITNPLTFKPQLFDLTQMFGSTIADYIYSLEQANAGAGVAWFRKLFPNDYYEYNAGELISVEGLESHNIVGFNQWDEEWELGYYNTANGNKYDSTTNIRSKNAIRVVPNTVYYVTRPNNVAVVVLQYDNGGNYISGANISSATTFTTLQNAGYVRFYMGVAYGTTYHNDICINLSKTTGTPKDGDYVAYEGHSYALDSSLTLRGIPKLDANNNLYYDGDVYESDGTVTRRFVTKTFNGTESWYSVITTGDPNINRALTTVTRSDAPIGSYSWNLIGTYVQSTGSGFSSPNLWKANFNNNGDLLIGIPSTITSISDWETYLSSHPLTIVYELATPTTESADSFQSPQEVDPYGTEEYVGSPIPVGHKTTYQRICPISGWDSVEVTRCGKNLFSKTLARAYAGLTEDNAIFLEAGTYVASASNIKNATSWRFGFRFFETNGTIIERAMSHGVSFTNIGAGFSDSYSSNTACVQTDNGTTTSITLTIDREMLISCMFAFGDTSSSTTCEYQLEFDSTATTYTPYNGQTYTSTFPKYKQQVSQDTTPYITKNIGDTYADTLTENLVGGTIAWNQSVPDTTTTHTISGSIASMDDAVAGNFESVVCDINPIQDLHGYDSPWVGGGGKNKFDRTNVVDGYVSATGYISTASSVTLEVTSDYISVMPSTAYIFSAKVNNSEQKWVGIGLYDADKTFITRVGGTKGNDIIFSQALSATDMNGVYYVRVSYRTYGIDTDAQFEQGSTATTWTPYSNICPISGTDSVGVVDCGKNLFDKARVTSLYCDGTAKLYENATFKSVYIPLKPNTSYVFSQTVFGNYDRFALCNSIESGEVIFAPTNKVSGYDSSVPLLFTNTNYKYLVCTIYRSTTDTNTFDEIADSCMLELGSTATTYESYSGTTKTVTLPQTTYGGSVDIVKGVNGGSETLGSVADLGSLSWTDAGSGGTYRFYSADLANNIVKATSNTDVVNLCCSMLNKASYADVYSHASDSIISVGTNGYLYAYVSNCLNTTEFVSAITGATLIYPLATPTPFSVTPTQVQTLLGQNNVWSDSGDISVTYPTNHSYQSLSTTHKYYKRINGVESISVGSDVVADVGTDNIIDLTQMFGTTIADYIYNREQSSSGKGIKFFKSLFPNDDYDYNSGELISVNASAHVIKDANGNVVHTYPLDSNLVLRGIPKLDANNKLYYDGDVYEPDGGVTRKYGVVDLGTLTWSYITTSDRNYFRAPISVKINTLNVVCDKYLYGGYMYDSQMKTVETGAYLSRDSQYIQIKDTTYTDAPTFKTAVTGKKLVYELATPTTETADSFEENQSIVPNGIEEYIVTEQGDVEMPVGHDSTYYATEVYGGTIDMAKGVLTINRKVVNLSSLSFVKYGSDTVYYASIPNKANGNTNILSNKFFLDAVAIANMADGSMRGYSTSATVYFRKNDCATLADWNAWLKNSPTQLVYELETPIEILLTPQQMQTLSGQNNIWSNTNGGMYLVYQLPITSLLVKRRDVADVSGKWLTLYSQSVSQASDMDFTFIDFLNQYGKTYQYALVPLLEQTQSGVTVEIEGGYTVSNNVTSIFDGVFITDVIGSQKVKANVGYGNVDMNQVVGSITPIGAKYPIVITNSQNQYHNGSISGTIVPDDYYFNGNLSRVDMVNKRDELEQFLTNKRAKIIKDWNGNIWLVMIMDNVSCTFNNNYGMGIVNFSTSWVEVGDPTNQQDLQATGLINVGGV